MDVLTFDPFHQNALRHEELKILLFLFLIWKMTRSLDESDGCAVTRDFWDKF